MNKKRRPIPKPNFEELIPILISVWRKFHNIKGGPLDRLQTREFRGVCEEIGSINQGLFEGQDLIGKEYFDQKKTLGAYILYHFVMHYSQGLSLLEELPSPPKRVLDLCSGPAAFALAGMRYGASESYALDRNPTALKLGAEICGKLGYTLTIRNWKADQWPLPVEGTFDLITLGYSLEELFPQNRKGWAEEQYKFIHRILSLLNPQGYLLLVENSWPAANNRLLRLRDQLVANGVPIQAPCVWKGECPALQSNSPCYTQRPFEKPFLIKELQRGSQINLNSLKMSYLILKSPQSQWPLPAYENLFRVISPFVDGIRGKKVYLCGTQGKKALGSRVENLPAESKAFEYLKRGDLIHIEGALESKNLMEIGPETHLHVKAPVGKPLPEKEIEK